MPKSCVTISLVKEARGGPFVFWDDLAEGCRQAKELGFDAVEVFPPSPEAVDTAQLKGLLEEYGLSLAAVGTGAGWVLRGQSLTSGDADNRAGAQDYVRSIIDLAGPFGASAIIGSMQGKHGDGVDRDTAIGYLRDACNVLGKHAKQYNVPLIYEPLNRYETNLINNIKDGVEFVKSLDTDNVTLLADLFHMNIEEACIAQAIRDGAGYIGHIHFVDSNRSAAGMGHMNYDPIIQAIKDTNYEGYLCAEAFAKPDSLGAAQQTIDTYRKYFS
ncbi:MAG: sugar phosphate isomerase/epimerase [Pirellulaceae bacterium]|jgi:sugar phosphate isomerase/epimerase